MSADSLLRFGWCSDLHVITGPSLTPFSPGNVSATSLTTSAAFLAQRFSLSSPMLPKGMGLSMGYGRGMLREMKSCSVIARRSQKPAESSIMVGCRIWGRLSSCARFRRRGRVTWWKRWIQVAACV